MRGGQRIASLDELREARLPEVFNAEVSFLESEPPKGAPNEILRVDAFYSLQVKRFLFPDKRWRVFLPITRIYLSDSPDQKASVLDWLSNEDIAKLDLESQELVKGAQNLSGKKYIHHHGKWYMPDGGIEKLNLCIAQNVEKTRDVVGRFPVSLRTKGYDRICEPSVLYVDGKAEKWIADVKKAAEEKDMSPDEYTKGIWPRINF